MNIKSPYLIFLGDAQDYKQAKVACGVTEWRPDLCMAQIKYPECRVELDLPVMTVAEAYAIGARTFVIGISPYETTLPERYISSIAEAIRVGLDIANPLHAKLPQVLIDLAALHKVEIHNFRHRSIAYPKGSGVKRRGLRLLTTGTDCAIGKKFTALSMSRGLTEYGVKNTFRSTGQTGFLISGSGINNDTIEADFLSGAAEWLSPDNDADHWDLIEGQGALSHPSFGAGALSLLVGSQPDVIVMCTEPGRATQRGVTMAPQSLEDEIADVLHIGRRTNPNIRLGAISVMTKFVNRIYALDFIRDCSTQFQVPVFDPYIQGPSFETFIRELKEMADVNSKSRA